MSKIDTALKSVDKTINKIQVFSQDAFIIVIVIITGVLLAYLTKYLVGLFIRNLDFLFKHVSNNDDFKKEQIKHNYARALSGIAFIAVLLLTLEVCSHIIGWKLFTVWVDKVSAFMPRVISSLLIILSGFLIGNVVANIIEKTGYSFEMLHIKAIAQLSKFIIILTLFLVGIEQIGVNIAFLTTFIAIITGVFLSGITLAFSLGAKDFVANLIGAQSARKQCRIGDIVEINSIKGQVIDVTKTEILLDTAAGKAVVPAKNFSERISIITNTKEDGESFIGNLFKKD